MKILMDITHPAQVHLFHPFCEEMNNRGHEILFTTREKEVTIDLLEAYGMKYISFGKKFKARPGKIMGVFKFVWMMYRIALRFKPDIFFSHGSIYSAATAFLCGKPHIAVEDTGNMEQIKIYLPLTKYILTPSVYHHEHGRKHIRYAGYHELAFLYPSRFKPNPAVLEHLGVKDNDPFIIIRFISWNATHDKGQSGIDFENKIRLVSELSKHAKVFISSEGELPPEFEAYRIKMPPVMMLDALYYCSMYIGEGISMASESGCLGTPALHINTMFSSYCDDLEKNYGLIYNYKSADGVLDKALEILNDPDYKQLNREKLRKLYDEKIDVTAFLVWFIENYPASGQIMTRNPEYQLRFKGDGGRK